MQNGIGFYIALVWPDIQLHINVLWIVVFGVVVVVWRSISSGHQRRG